MIFIRRALRWLIEYVLILVFIVIHIFHYELFIALKLLFNLIHIQNFLSTHCLLSIFHLPLLFIVLLEKIGYLDVLAFSSCGHLMPLFVPNCTIIDIWKCVIEVFIVVVFSELLYWLTAIFIRVCHYLWRQAIFVFKFTCCLRHVNFKFKFNF